MSEVVKHKGTNGLFIILSGLVCECFKRVGVLLSDTARFDVATASWRSPHPTKAARPNAGRVCNSNQATNPGAVLVRCALISLLAIQPARLTCLLTQNK